MTLAANCPPLTLPNGTVTYEPPNQVGSFSEGTVAYGMCSIGFALFGTSSTLCENGKWKYDFGECKEHLPVIGDPRKCYTMVVPNGNITFNGNLPPYEFEVPEGTTGHLSCTKGFEVVGGSTDFTCKAGTWTPMLGACQLKNCTPPAVIPKTCAAMAAPPGASLSYSNSSSTGPFPQGTLVVMKCNSGNPEGPAAASCFEGNWYPPMLGTCSTSARNATAKCGVEVTCNGLITYSDGKVLEFMKDTGTTGTLACDVGLIPDGPTSTYCQDGKWTPQLGSCVGQCP
ncbi:sushi domain protein [Ancylostoma caninum]|uniref:Sushi domain protein n=1 Tax=Ancylostoma caninum TaxID=29170 RepID=A0A368H0P0_ANCCA|nr:sushi domain protein [Ancylostoma caninum]